MAKAASIYERLTAGNRKLRKDLQRRLYSDNPGLDVVHANAAGIDIGNESHFVAVPPAKDAEPVREFGSWTADLEHMAAWLKSCGIETVAMQSTKLMMDLQVLAWQGDVTRVTVFQLARETSNRAYTELGIGEGHHPLTHNGGNQEMLAKCAQINAYHVSMFAYLLEKLRATPDGDGNLLDHSALLYGSGMSDADRHDHTNLPIIVAGGRFMKFPEHTPLANLHLTLLDRVGVMADSFADSTGKVQELMEPLTL